MNPAFLRGMVTRTSSLIESGKMVEASHYMSNVFLDIVENYIWLKSSTDKVKVDYTTLLRSFESLEEKSPKTHKYAIKLLNLNEMTNTPQPTQSRKLEKLRSKYVRKGRF